MQILLNPSECNRVVTLNFLKMDIPLFLIFMDLIREVLTNETHSQDPAGPPIGALTLNPLLHMGHRIVATGGFCSNFKYAEHVKRENEHQE